LISETAAATNGDTIPADVGKIFEMNGKRRSRRENLTIDPLWSVAPSLTFLFDFFGFHLCPI
jgi:hypothetical protein